MHFLKKRYKLRFNYICKIIENGVFDSMEQFDFKY
jgi:hypothetical protein